MTTTVLDRAIVRTNERNAQKRLLDRWEVVCRTCDMPSPHQFNQIPEEELGTRHRIGLDPRLPPAESGVYFVWGPCDYEINYVGTSHSLRRRVVPSHEHINEYDRVSWVLFEPEERMYAELFYIWLMQPPRNKLR